MIFELGLLESINVLDCRCWPTESTYIYFKAPAVNGSCELTHAKVYPKKCPPTDSSGQNMCLACVSLMPRTVFVRCSTPASGTNTSKPQNPLPNSKVLRIEKCTDSTHTGYLDTLHWPGSSRTSKTKQSKTSSSLIKTSTRPPPPFVPPRLRSEEPGCWCGGCPAIWRFRRLDLPGDGAN